MNTRMRYCNCTTFKITFANIIYQSNFVHRCSLFYQIVALGKNDKQPMNLYDGSQDLTFDMTKLSLAVSREKLVL